MYLYKIENCFSDKKGGNPFGYDFPTIKMVG